MATMQPPHDPLPRPNDAFLKALDAAMQADENDEAVYGWMAEQMEEDLSPENVSGGKATDN